MSVTRLVVSFNRHFFAIALLACAVGLTLIAFLESPWLKTALAAGVGLAAYFMVASVVAAFFAYDASDLYQLKWWPTRCLPKPPETGVVVHAGFELASARLQAKYPQMRLRVLSFFDPGKTTETSIQVAHRLAPPVANEEPIAAESWPVASGSQDVVFALNAAHELRKAEDRVAFFREARRVLKPEGKVIVIEQLRDLHNFACFGIAAFHFLSHRTWLRSFTEADLKVTDEFALSLWMRAFVLQAC